MHPSEPWKPQELAILRLLAQGLTNREIAGNLHLSPDTIRWYNKRIFEKLGASNRTQAVHLAKAFDLLGQPADSPTRHPPVRYVANGDVHLAYQLVGSGPVDMLFIHGFLSHVELAWENPEFAQFFSELGRYMRVILFDKRGMGLSDRIQGAPTLEQTISDALCVLDAAGSERAYIMGTSEGGAAAALLAATWPERVHGLILYAATPLVARQPDETEPLWAAPLADFEAMTETMLRTWGTPWALASFAPSRAKNDGFGHWWGMLLRSAASPASVKAVLKTIAAVDIRPLLPAIRTRTLIVHKREDQIVTVEAGRYLADQLPNATLVELPGADHIYFVESEEVVKVILDFCRHFHPTSALANNSSTRLATILHATNLGPASAYLRPLQPRYSATADGSMTTVFDGPGPAIHCARTWREAVPDAHFGLHFGACHAEKWQPLPAAQRVTRQAATAAERGQVLVTQALYNLVVGTPVPLTPGPLLAPDLRLYALTDTLMN